MSELIGVSKIAMQNAQLGELKKGVFSLWAQTCIHKLSPFVTADQQVKWAPEIKNEPQEINKTPQKIPRITIEASPQTPSTTFQTSPRYQSIKYFNDTPRAPLTPRTTAFEFSGLTGQVDDQIRNMIADFEDVSSLVRTNTDELLGQCSKRKIEVEQQLKLLTSNESLSPNKSFKVPNATEMFDSEYELLQLLKIQEQRLLQKKAKFDKIDSNLVQQIRRQFEEAMSSYCYGSIKTKITISNSIADKAAVIDFDNIRLSDKLDANHSRLLTFEWPDKELRNLLRLSKNLENLQIVGGEHAKELSYFGRWNFTLSNGLKTDSKSDRPLKPFKFIDLERGVRHVQVFYHRTTFLMAGLRLLDKNKSVISEAGYFGGFQIHEFSLEQDERIIGFVSRPHSRSQVYHMDLQFMISKIK